MNALRTLVRRICPLEEQEAARKIISDRLRDVRREMLALTEAAMQVDDPGLAAAIRAVSQEALLLWQRAAR